MLSSRVDCDSAPCSGDLFTLVCNSGRWRCWNLLSTGSKLSFKINFFFSFFLLERYFNQPLNKINVVYFTHIFVAVSDNNFLRIYPIFHILQTRSEFPIPISTGICSRSSLSVENTFLKPFHHIWQSPSDFYRYRADNIGLIFGRLDFRIWH